MRINTNISSMNACRNMSINNQKLASSTEKLSSGYRINGAKDDAAGLSISEKMRSQIRGLNQASSNAEDANSLLQTAEGALNESTSILQRMNELAVQAANDTNVDADRTAIQDEMDALSEELTRIANTTEFNEQKLLDGKFSGTFHIGANGNQNISISIDNMGAKALGVAGATDGQITIGNYIITNISGENITIQTAKSTENNNAEVTTTTANYDKDNKILTITLAQAKGDDSNPGVVTATNKDVINAINNSGLSGIYATLKEGANGNDGAADITAGTELDAATKFDEKKGIDVSSQGAANNAIETIQNAIQKVSSQRSKIGAYQNRLEHTINNLGTSSENLSAAESRIRDVDMATEMSEYTKNNVLVQAAQAMVAQANAQPQSVLSLLQ